jgi:hypothetical protein
MFLTMLSSTRKFCPRDWRGLKETVGSRGIGGEADKWRVVKWGALRVS